MRTATILSVIAFLLLIGCSSDISPVTPDNYKTSGSTDRFPIINLATSSDASSAVGLLGAFKLRIDPETMTADLSPIRNSRAIGDSFLIEGMAYFTIFPCTDCFKITGLELTPENYVRIYFTLNHPFPKPPDPCVPPGRIDLDVFDVALLIQPYEITPDSYPLTQAGAYTKICPNADGYTKELGTFLSDNAALPYFLVIDDNEDSQSTFNKLEQGAVAPFAATLDPAHAQRFTLYLTMGYGASATRPTRCYPEYFNPEFNKKNAWKVDVIPPAPLAGSTWTNTDNTTEYDIEVHVWDWQQGANVADPPMNDDVRYSSNVASVSAEIPGMNNTLPSVSDEESGTGNDPADPLIYKIPIANENLLAIGEYTGLVKVTDERVPPSNPKEGDVDALIHSPDGTTLNWFQIDPEFATYQTFTATVLTGVGPIKNIPLRDGFEALDLAVDHADGDLFILFDDGEIWKYTEAAEYQDGTPLPDEAGFNMEYIDIAPNSYIVVAGYKSGLDNGKFFRPDGTYFKDFNYGTYNPACHVYDALAYTGSILTNYLGVATCGCPSGTYAKWIVFPPSQYSMFVTPSPYIMVGCGETTIGYKSDQNQGTPTREIIMGVECGNNSMDYVYYLESHTTAYECDEYRVQRLYRDVNLKNDPSVTWGGEQSDDMALGFWDPQDISRDSDNNFHIFDILSTDEPAIKKYTEDGTVIGMFGDSISINGTPLRIEGSDYVGPDGNLMFVIHEDSPADLLSVFFPSEMP
jgi:hypothetical protein